ncbi:MAG: Crp/Fnr family transcriptional regulator [Longimicrobiales bacterium]
MPTDTRPLRAAFDALTPIPEEEWQRLATHVRERRFPRGAHLIREGELASQLHLVVEGLVRLYHAADGRELTRGFDFQGRFTGAYHSILTGRPSLDSIQALESTLTLSFPGALLLQFYEGHRCWDRMGRKLLELQSLRTVDKEMRFRRCSPEEHYQLLIDRHSPLVTRVPLNHLASYLGVTPETLSRIRARMRKRAV